MPIYTQPNGKMYNDAAAHDPNDQISLFPSDELVAEMGAVADDRMECWENTFTLRTGPLGTGGPIT